MILIYLTFHKIENSVEFVQNCYNFYIESTKNLIIPQGIICEFKEYSYYSLTELDILRIDGTLKIEDNFSLYFSFNKLIIGEVGLIQIGKESQIITSQIVFTNKSEEECILEEPQGRIYVNSRPYLYFKVDNLQNIEQQTPQIGQYFKVSDQIVQYMIQSHEIVKSQITQIKEEFQTSNQSQLLHSSMILFHNVQFSQGVLFQNICLSVKVKKMVGAGFMNLKGINFQGVIRKSQFIDNNDMLTKNNSNPQSSRRRILKIIAVGCIFYNIKNMEIIFKEGEVTAEHNLYLGLSQVQFSLDPQHNKNNKPNSPFQSLFSELLIKDSTFYNSQISSELNNCIQNCNYIIKSSKIIDSSLSLTGVFNCVIQFSNFTNTTAKFLDKVQVVQIYGSSFLGKNEKNYFMKFVDQLYENDQTTILIYDCLFKEFENEIFQSSIKNEKMDNNICGYFDNCLYNIKLSNIKYQPNLQKIGMFNLPLMQIFVEEGYSISQIIQEKARPANLRKPILQILSNQTDLYQVKESFNMLKFDSIKLIEKDINYQNQLSEGYEVIQGEYKIFSKKISRFFLEDLLGDSHKNGNHFQIEEVIFNLYQKEVKDNTPSHQKNIWFLSRDSVIKNFTANATIMREDGQIDSTTQFQYTAIRQIEYIEFQFQVLPAQTVQMTFTFEYCPFQQKFNGQECVTGCPLKQIEEYCVYSCPNGYFTLQENQQKCEVCKSYDVKLNQYCSECLPYLVKQNGECVEECQGGSFQLWDLCVDK